MIPIDQLQRLENEIESITVEGLKALQLLPDTLLYKTLKEGLKINRYRTRRSVTREIPITQIRELIQETIIDKLYDRMLESMMQ